MKRVLLSIYYKFLVAKDKIIMIYNRSIVSTRKTPDIFDTDATLEKLVRGKYSISRFGDGEFGLMRGRGLIFQPYSSEIRKRLLEVIKSNHTNHLVGIPDVFVSLDKYEDTPKNYWNKYLELNRNKIYKLLNKEKVYYDALVTRLYIDYKDKSSAKQRFNKMKNIWNARDIVIVEGEKSRLGIGNDLFSDAKSIERIICPAQDAFAHYSTILSEVNKQSVEKLILIALGPTATILAYDLAKINYQAIDIGHIDIEYEWFLQGVLEKIPVKSKYIGEIRGGSNVKYIFDEEYEKQIISIINR